jgi:hypothetical protein
MTLPPALARLDYGVRRFWLPLILLWPLLLLLFVLTAFTGAIAMALTQNVAFQGLGRFIYGLYQVICAARGMQIEINTAGNRFGLLLY